MSTELNSTTGWQCGSCGCTDHERASALQPALCYDCVQAALHTPAPALDQELCDLTVEIFASTFGFDWGDAYVAALAQLPDLLAYAALYDGQVDCQRRAAGVELMPEGDMLTVEGMRV